MNNTKTSILIVEDEAIVAEHLKQTLEKLGYSISDIVASGVNALACARKSASNHIDLVLMDIILDGPLDGISTARRLRDLVDCPIIYLTAYADKNTLEQAKGTEVYGYILKPIRPDALHASIQVALNKYENEHTRSKQYLKDSVRYNPTALVAAAKLLGAKKGLTPMELKILQLLAAGASRRLLARSEHRSINTIKIHLKQIYRKLGITGQRDLLRALNSQF